MAMASLKLLLNKGRTRSDGTFPLVFQLIHRRQKKLLYTPYRLAETEFDVERALVVQSAESRRSRRQVNAMNRELRQMSHQLRSCIRRLEQRDQLFTADDVVRMYRKAYERVGLLAYFDMQVERKREQNKRGMAAALHSTRASVSAFLGGRSVNVSDVDAALVHAYEEFLAGRGVSRNTVCYYMRNFRVVYNRAREEGLSVGAGDAFAHMHVGPCRTVKRALADDSLRRLLEADFSGSRAMDMARDLFLFSFYTRGMPFVDVVCLRKSDVQGGVITYSRHKTGQSLQIALLPQTEALIRKYDNPSEFVFPLLVRFGVDDKYVSYRKALGWMNYHLKCIARACGITTRLTTYVARHSWATRAKLLGVPVSVISESLGHTSERTTQIYLKEFDRSVVDAANERVAGL